MFERAYPPGEGKQAARVIDCCLLDHAEHDRADEGHGEVRGDNAQSSGERHEVAPSMRGPFARMDHG